MNAFGTIVAIIGVMAAGIIYGTDVFCAIIQRPALSKVGDATAAAVMGRVHQYGDRRLPVPGVIGILAAVVTTAADAVSGSPAGAVAAGIALIAMLAGSGSTCASRPGQPRAHRRGHRRGDSCQLQEPAVALEQRHHPARAANGDRGSRAGSERRDLLTYRLRAGSSHAPCRD